MADFARKLSNLAGRTVRDETGLTDQYKVALSWMAGTRPEMAVEFAPGAGASLAGAAAAVVVVAFAAASKISSTDMPCNLGRR